MAHTPGFIPKAFEFKLLKTTSAIIVLVVLANLKAFGFEGQEFVNSIKY
jgi:hypothetical protein